MTIKTRTINKLQQRGNQLSLRFAAHANLPEKVQDLDHWFTTRVSILAEYTEYISAVYKIYKEEEREQCRSTILAENEQNEEEKKRKEKIDSMKIPS